MRTAARHPARRMVNSAVGGDSVFPHDADQNAQDVDAVAEDRFHRLVGRLETNPVPISVDFLERRFAFLVAHRDDLAVACLFLPPNDHEVAVGDVFIDHGVARDAQSELVARLHPVAEGELLVLLDRLDRLAGGDVDRRASAPCAAD